MNAFKTTILLAAMTALFLIAGEAIGGPNGLVLGFGFARVAKFVSYFFSDTIVLRRYAAQEVGPDHRLARIVSVLPQRAGLPQPRCYVIPDASPNAFATGRNPQHAAVAATEGIMQILHDDELAAVLGHELAHVKHGDILTSSIAATLAGAIMVIARMAFWFGGSRDDREGGNPVAAIAMMVLAPLAAMLIQAAISRSREYDADAGGAAIAGHPDGLVKALRKIEAGSKLVPLDASPATAHMFIVKPFSVSGLMGLFSTHPPTEDRIAALLQLDRH